MTLHRAVCADCGWTFEDEELVTVSDKMERHARKDHHHVDLERAARTDSDAPQPADGDEGVEILKHTARGKQEIIDTDREAGEQQ